MKVLFGSTAIALVAGLAGTASSEQLGAESRQEGTNSHYAAEPANSTGTDRSVGFCSKDTLEQVWFSVSTGEITSRRPPLDPFSFPQDNWYLAGTGVGTTSGFGPIVCGIGHPPLPTLWNSDYSMVIGIAKQEDQSVVATLDLAANMAARILVEPEEESDFGPAPVTAINASFTPNGSDFLWIEKDEEICSVYQAPTAEAPIARSNVESFIVAAEVDCNSNAIVFDDNSLVLCREAVHARDIEGPCVDLAGFGVETPDLWVDSDPPVSSRFDIGEVFLSSSGVRFFTGTSEESGLISAFVWDDPEVDPRVLGELGSGRWVVLGEMPKAGTSESGATLVVSVPSSGSLVAEDAIIALEHIEGVVASPFDGYTISCDGGIVIDYPAGVIAGNTTPTIIFVLDDWAGSSAFFETTLEQLRRVGMNGVTACEDSRDDRFFEIIVNDVEVVSSNEEARFTWAEDGTEDGVVEGEDQVTLLRCRNLVFQTFGLMPSEELLTFLGCGSP